jgi:hypothetical protein
MHSRLREIAHRTAEQTPSIAGRMSAQLEHLPPAKASSDGETIDPIGALVCVLATEKAAK